MLTGDSNTSTFEGSLNSGRLREFDLAVRELELKRREAAIRTAEQARALPRVDASYFSAGHNTHEDDWWAKQFGSR